jgi:iron-sulfur cluster assembly accessory protein
MCTHGITIEAVLNGSSTRLPDTRGVGFDQESIKESEMTTEVTTTTGIQLTDVAAAKVSALLAQEGRDDLNLRVAVQPGGCSGLKYQLYFDDRNMDGDIVREFGAVKVITDKMSDPYLSGATIDFVDTIEKQGFTIDNPQAQGSCACGDSFN